MSRILPQKEGNLNGVIAEGASTGRYSLPIGARYHFLALKWAYNSSTFNLADITEVRVKVNGKSIMQLSATDVDIRNQVMGLSASGTTGILMIPFERYNLKQRSQEEDTALNTGVAGVDGSIIKTLEIECTFSGDQTTATVELFSGVSPKLLTNAKGEPYGAGTINHVLKQPYTPISASGDVLISDLPKTGAEFQAIERMIIKSTNDVVTDIVVKKNRNILFDIPTSLIDVLNPNGVRANVAGVQVVDFTFQGDGRPDTPLALIDADSFDVTLTVSADMGSASSAYIICDYLGSIGR